MQHSIFPLPIRTFNMRMIVKKKYRAIMMWNAASFEENLSETGSYSPP